MRNKKGKNNKVVDRFAGDAFKKQRDKVRDWAVANWDNPSKKEIKKFEKATGYPQYLGGYRDEYRDDYMQDGQIDYFADHKSYNKVFNKIGKKTGLNFNRVEDPSDAEIFNTLNPATSGTWTLGRKDRKGGTGKTYSVTYEGFEERGQKDPAIQANPNLYIGGTSYAVDPRDFGDTPERKEYHKDILDMHQVNVVNALRGDNKTKNANVWHEIGHSLGLAGDLTLTDKDPSVMSYNHAIKGSKFGPREYESIKKLHSMYM